MKRLDTDCDMETHPLADEFTSIFIQNGGYQDAYEAFKVSTMAPGSKVKIRSRMPKSNTSASHYSMRRQSIASRLSSAFGEELPQEDKVKQLRERSANYSRLDSLPRELQKIRKEDSLQSRDDMFGRMVATWHSTIKAYMSPKKATLHWLFAWRIELKSPLGEFVVAAAESQGLLLKQAKYWLILRCLFSLAIYTADFTAAFMLAMSYIHRSKMQSAILTLAWPFLALLIHALVAIVSGESWSIVAASLFGLKPLIDTWRVIAGQTNDLQKKIFSPVLALGIGRLIELVFESIPQTCTQTYLMVQAHSSDLPIDTMQYVTVLTSLMAIGFIAAFGL